MAIGNEVGPVKKLIEHCGGQMELLLVKALQATMFIA